MEMALPKVPAGWKLINRTLRYSNFSKTFVVYSRQRDLVLKLMKTVHHFNPNETFNWILSHNLLGQSILLKMNSKVNLVVMVNFFPNFGIREEKIKFKESMKILRPTENFWLSQVVTPNSQNKTFRELATGRNWSFLITKAGIYYNLLAQTVADIKTNGTKWNKVYKNKNLV